MRKASTYSRLLIVAFAPLLLLRATVAQAQTPDSVCSYTRCGLNIIPRLTALDVVRGEREARVGSLAFLWPHDVSPVFSNDTLARSYARRATAHRRVAAVLTDAGLALAASGVVGMLRDGGHSRGATGFAAIGGAVLVSTSIPVHFAADADLSRAVWRYNQAITQSGRP